jgi:hypothetical protein
MFWGIITYLNYFLVIWRQWVKCWLYFKSMKLALVRANGSGTDYMWNCTDYMWNCRKIGHGHGLYVELQKDRARTRIICGTAERLGTDTDYMWNCRKIGHGHGLYVKLQKDWARTRIICETAERSGTDTDYMWNCRKIKNLNIPIHNLVINRVWVHQYSKKISFWSRFFK